MAIINRSQLLDRMIRDLGLDPIREKIPRELSSKILPTFSLKERPVVRSNRASATTATTATIITGTTEKRTFIKHMTVDFNQDGSTTTAMNGRINITPLNSNSIRLAEITFAATTVDRFNLSHTFDGDGIELEPGSAVTLSLGGTIGAGNAVFSSSIIVNEFDLDR